MKKQHRASIPQDEVMIERFRKDPKFAADFLKYIMEEATDEEGQRVLLRVLKYIAEARGIGKVAKAVGMPRQSLSRALSPKGNPRFDTLFSIVSAMGMKMTVLPA